MTPVLARTTAEAHLYMDLEPCAVCGGRGLSPDSSVVLVDGRLCSRYAGACPHCRTRREFTFLLPEQILLPLAEAVVFGGPEPSELLDPGQWLAVADLAAAGDPDGTPANRTDLLYAAAALDEVLKFVPPGAVEVPAGAVRTGQGHEVYDREPGRFRRDRLAAVAQAYRDLAARS